MAHLHRLQGKRLDLLLAPFPGTGEAVVDQTAGLAAVRARDDGAGNVGVGDPRPVVVVAARLRGRDEPGAHPHALCAERECGGKAASVRQSPTGQHRHLHRVDHRRNEGGGADPSDMTAPVHAGGDNGVDAVGNRLLGMPHGADHGHHANAALAGRGNNPGGTAQTRDQHGNPFVQHHLDHPAHGIGVARDPVALRPQGREQDIDAEGPAGPIPDRADLGPQLRTVHRRARTDDTEAAGLGDGGGQVGPGHPAHARLEDRMLDAEPFAYGRPDHDHAYPPPSRAKTPPRGPVFKRSANSGASGLPFGMFSQSR